MIATFPIVIVAVVAVFLLVRIAAARNDPARVANGFSRYGDPTINNQVAGHARRPDASAMIRDLRSPVRDAPRSDPIIAFVVAVITFGLYPAVIWPLRFRHVIDADRDRLGRVAQWLGERGGHPQTPHLWLSADAIRFRPLLYLFGAVSCAAWIVLLFACGALNRSLLMAVTYSSHSTVITHGDWARQFLLHGAGAPPWALRGTLFAGWVIALSLAFLTHWVQVQLHASSVRKFLDRFNQIAIHDGLSPVFLSPLGVGIGPMWVIGAVAVTLMNAPWSIPLMLAGSVQRRYVARAGPRMRDAVASRIRDMTLLPQPTSAAPTVPPKPAPSALIADVRARCTTEGCRLPLPAGARFCPRCGRRSVPKVDRVA